MGNKEVYSDCRIAVPLEFENVFSHFYFAENKSGDKIVKTLLPSYQTIMVFSFGAPVSFIAKQGNSVEMNKCIVLGPIKHAFDYAMPPKAEILVVSFKDDAFFRFFGTAFIAENFPFNPDELLNKNCFTALWTRLNEINGVSNRVSYFLDFCKPYLRNRNTIAVQIADFDDNDISSVKEISKKNNLSERAVQMNHKKHFGYSAKEISRYQRFIKAIQLIQGIASGTTKVNWFEIIEACGYYDQSQLIHDFKHYIDLTPSEYLKFQESICNANS